MIKEFTCQFCNKVFTRNIYPSKPADYSFCSPSCRNKARSLDKISCPVCGDMFSPRINDTGGVRKRYCSSKCGNASKRGKISTNPKTHVDSDNKFVIDFYPKNGAAWVAEKLGYTKSAITNLANRLGVKLDASIYRDLVHGGARKYMLKNNPMKNKETAQKVGFQVSRKYWGDEDYRNKLLANKSKSMKKSMTKPELLCKRLLEEIGIEAEYQVEVKSRFIVDFRIGNIILQVDGEYWHGHPRFEPLTERQIAQRKRDAAQDSYLTAYGYKVIRIWENQITKENIIKLLS